ncbi:hypothetical protein Rsub_11558 [Raphidocelis subcapitata]|uniref:Uncharacterized protein n=1 Tax=Raphidocelis subcapitata TaxID=307507 RepID=A0A2V0PIW8_9CHLO|nr:hypothetical protein Rsub_11558 [Raphidocelis subcapitata]|eukprot:GBF98972.1 hypothetical protein Rsub_11558 [Raphidocelis subcapitata]
MASAARSLLLLASCLGLLGAALAQDACLIEAKINPELSKYSLGGNVTKPVKGKISEEKVAARGSVYLRLPGGACPKPPLSAAQLAAALPAARLAAAPAGRPVVAFDPPKVASVVLNEANGKPIADWSLDGFSFNLHSNAPLGAGAAAPAGAPACTQVVLANGTLRLDSPLVGKRSASLSTVAQNTSMAVAAAVSPAGDALTLKIGNASFVFDISPEKTPGVHSTTMTHLWKGDIVAVADLTDPATFITADAKALDWNAKPRLWQPTVTAPCDTGFLATEKCEEPKPAFVPAAGAPGSCQVDAAAAAKAAAGGAGGAASGAAGRAAGAAAAVTAAAAVAAALVL